MKKPELLAPAGSPEHFWAAVENGADAVYFGGKRFNARQSADNLERDRMKATVEYAHGKGVKAYMTLNTLVKQEELETAVLQAEEGAGAEVDAFIVQDLGLAALLRQRFPEIPLHFSTQGTVYDASGVEFARHQGFKRVVLAREMNLDTIKNCSGIPGIETEVFVHGALCMCLSGQCSMSSLIGDRSGNRGSCAQPCRKGYALENQAGEGLGERGFLLSPKDICCLGELAELMQAGVTSFKIEGRLKTPEYTALTVKTFRKYMDEIYAAGEAVPVEKQDMDRLEQIFSRGGFTKGYLYGKQNAALLSGDSPKHRGLFLGIVGDVRTSAINRGKKVISIDLKRTLSVGDGIEILGKGFPGGIVTYIKGRNGNAKNAGIHERVWIGDIPGTIKKGELVYKVSDKGLLKEIRRTYENPDTGKEQIRGFFLAREGAPMQFTVTDSRGNQVGAEGDSILEAARNRATDRETVANQLARTGNTPYVLAECRIEMDENLMIPLSQINKVRRKALERLEHGE